jgi:hypothetical protein
VDAFDRRDEAIAAARQGLDEAGIIGRVAEGVTQAVHRRIQSVVEIHEGVGGPEVLPQFVARDQIAGTRKQVGQDVERLATQT